MDITISDELASKIREAQQLNELRISVLTDFNAPFDMASSIIFDRRMFDLSEIQADITNELYDHIGEEEE
ncbi:MAG: hypothetical protein JKY50_12900 [Oleispira sp.]|nr:hypothetical protein [Oleispira sp.]